MNQGSNAMLAPPGAISASGKSENNNMIADRRGSSRMTVVPEDKACCYDNPVSNKGKLFQMFRALSLMLVPLLALAALACYWMVINVVEKQTLEDEKSQITRGQKIASVAYALQRERASVVYALQESNISMLGESFQRTDKVMRALTVESNCFPDKEVFLTNLTNHRELLRTNLYLNRTDTEVNYYNEFTHCIMEDLMGLAKDMQHGTLWQDHVSFKMLLQATESAGMLLSLGIAFFERGSLPLKEYTRLRAEDTSAKEYIDIATLFSPFTKKKWERLQATQSSIFETFDIFRGNWLINNYTEAGQEKGREFHEAVMRYFNLLVELTEDVAQKVMASTDDEIDIALNMVTVACLVFIFVLVMTPVLIKMMHMLTSSIQNYAIEASQKSEQLVEEKARSDSLLYQMLPKSVAQALKMNQTVDAECYDQVTVCFSDIVGFTTLAAASTPFQVVVLLNSLYHVFDETLDHYDVYKVETIGDAYMVVSGLPQRNGSLHVIEISLMALELLRVTQEFVIPHMPGRIVQLRIGCHSGSAVAGVVGTKMPRYCLFGDTVNTASRMESHGMPNSIHISSHTHQLLQNCGGFTVERRGVVEIKGKGPMETFFLMSTTRPYRSSTRVSLQQSLHKISLQQQGTLILDPSSFQNGEGNGDVGENGSVKSSKQVAWSAENALV